jgi:hypothetical protein
MPQVQMSIDPKVLWVDTGLTLDGTTPLTIEVLSGTWTANPANGLVDANGHRGLIAKPGYNLPGEREGLLVGRIGTSIFAIGTSYSVSLPPAGALSLSINDDMFGEYGAGFTDNRGSIKVRITYG